MRIPRALALLLTLLVRAHAARAFQLLSSLSLATASEPTSTTVRAIVRPRIPVRVDGGLDASVIAREVEARLGQIRECYKSRLKLVPNLSGVLQIRVKLSHLGKVASQEVETDAIHDDELKRCVTVRITMWHFPPLSVAVSAKFSYPFVFETSK